MTGRAWTLGLCLALAGAGPAMAAEEDAATRRAREELERELRQTTRLPPPTVEIRYEGIDSTRYPLLEASFALDGKPLPPALTPGPPPKAPVMLYFGIVSPGAHTLTASLTFQEQGAGNPVFTYVNGARFKVPGKVTLLAQRGLVLKVRLRVEVDDGAALEKKLQLVADVVPQMVARVEEPPAPTSVAAPDAGVPLVVAAPDAGTAVAASVARKPSEKPGKPYTRMATGDWGTKPKKSPARRR